MNYYQQSLNDNKTKIKRRWLMTTIFFYSESQKIEGKEKKILNCLGKAKIRY